jgi:hypothetical protein
LYSTPDGATQNPAHLNTVNKAVGGVTSSVNLVPSSSINALAFDSSGVLYGLSAGTQGSGATSLVIIGLNGSVTTVGQTLNFLDGLAFQPDAAPGVVPEPASVILLGSGLLGLAARRRRSRK